MFNYISNFPDDLKEKSSGLEDTVQTKKKPQFEEIITLSNLYDTVSECCNGVRWKPSITRFENLCAC